LRPLSVATDREIVLGTVTGAAGAFAAWFATRFVALDEGTTKQTIERWHLPQQVASTPAQSNRSLVAQLGAHNRRYTYITGLLIWFVGQIDSLVNPSLVDTVGELELGVLGAPAIRGAS